MLQCLVTKHNGAIFLLFLPAWEGEREGEGRGFPLAIDKGGQSGRAPLCAPCARYRFSALSEHFPSTFRALT